jgi:hypothetical protein
LANVSVVKHVIHFGTEEYIFYKLYEINQL